MTQHDLSSSHGFSSNYFEAQEIVFNCLLKFIFITAAYLDCLGDDLWPRLHDGELVILKAESLNPVSALLLMSLEECTMKSLGGSLAEHTHGCSGVLTLKTERFHSTVYSVLSRGKWTNNPQVFSRVGFKPMTQWIFIYNNNHYPNHNYTVASGWWEPTRKTPNARLFFRYLHSNDSAKETQTMAQGTSKEPPGVCCWSDFWFGFLLCWYAVKKLFSPHTLDISEQIFSCFLMLCTV